MSDLVDGAPITDIILWLDCDREGEAICFEVLEVLLDCTLTKESFNIDQIFEKSGIKIHRARFSAATKGDLVNAISNLELPDINQKEVTYFFKLLVTNL